MFGLSAMFESKPKDCVLWDGIIARNGYGKIRVGGKLWSVHRLVMAILSPEEFKRFPQVNHKCDNKSCYNPNHLYCGTAQDNSDDQALKNVPLHWRPEHREYLNIELEQSKSNCRDLKPLKGGIKGWRELNIQQRENTK